MKKFIAILLTASMLTMLSTATFGSEEPAEEQEPAVETVTEETSAEEAADAETEAAEEGLQDGEYQIAFTMEGGSGKASIMSPCVLHVKDGEITATLIWSSENYDYMIVDEVKYDPVAVEGGSTFEVPVKDLTQPFTVIGDTTAMSMPHEIEYVLTFDPDSLKAMSAALEDGVYSAEFNTDSSMFHVNEACEGKGTLTVKDGEMTIHVSLVSKKIKNLFPGLAEDAEKEGAQLLQPTVDEVTYSDGYTEDVHGFDVPVPALDEEFDLAIIGEKGEWYDHKVSVTNPQPLEETAE